MNGRLPEGKQNQPGYWRILFATKTITVWMWLLPQHILIYPVYLCVPEPEFKFQVVMLNWLGWVTSQHSTCKVLEKSSVYPSHLQWKLESCLSPENTAYCSKFGRSLRGHTARQKKYDTRGIVKPNYEGMWMTKLYILNIYKEMHVILQQYFIVRLTLQNTFCNAYTIL